MRRVIAFALCLMLCFNLAMPAFAVGGASTTCTLSTDVLNPGDEVTVTVTLSGCVDVKSIGLTPTYDKDVFEMVSGQWADMGALLANFDMRTGNAAAAFGSATDINGEIFTFVLRVKDGADASGARISTAAIIKDANNQNVDCTAQVTTVPEAEAPTPAPTDPPTDPVDPTDPTDPVVPSDGAVVTATVNTAEVQAGDEVTVTVTLSGCVDVKSMGLTPTYDKNVFELVSGEWADLGALLANFDMRTGNAAIAFGSATDINGQIFTFVLKVKDAAAAGTSAVSATAIIKDSANQNVSSTTVAADVTVGEAECTHPNKTEVPSKSPDCVNAGNHQYYTCDSCGAVLAADGVTQTTVEEMTIPALGHDPETVPAVPATCTSTGLTEGEVCSRCGLELVPREVIPMLAHDWTPADCDTAKTCKVCGATEGEALGHDWTPADCDTPKTCKTCGTTEGEALGHDWTAADCTHPATCKVCGETTGEPDLTNHVGQTEIRNAKPATEEEEGYTGDTYCTACNTLIAKGEVIPKLDHVHDLKKTDAVAATCEAEGNTAYWSCDKCGKIYADEAATAEITLEKTVVPALGHDWTVADCVTPATCKVCGETTGEPDLTGHVGETEIRDAKPATEDAEGYTGDTYCKSCGHVVAKGEVIPKLDHVHSLTKIDAVAPTCTEEGNIAYWYCNKCGNLYADEACTTPTTVDGTKVAPTGHDWTEATCTEPATCEICHLTEGEALGHSFTSYISNNDATCEADGTETAKCDRCDVTDTRTVPGSALGHTAGAEWVTSETEHWHVCGTCETKLDLAAHTPNVDAATTETAKFCTVCNYEMEPKLDAPVDPEQPAAITVDVAADTLLPGDEITVTVTLSNCADIKSMGLTPVYDDEVFELVGGKWLVENAVIANFDAVNGNAALAFSVAADINGPIFEFTLRVREGASGGSASVSATAIINDSNNVQVENESKEDAVTIELYGDANGDGRINAKDAALILEYSVADGEGVECNTVTADVNGDGKINAKDAAMILAYAVDDTVQFPAASK